MEEIDEEFFKAFPFKTLNEQEARPRQDQKTLKKVYKHMLSQMELWFNHYSDSSTGMRLFKPEIIDLKKLIEFQDINELLVLIEFVLCIVLKCENSENLLSRFLEL